MNDLKAGVYRHYKGPLYLVLGLGHDANADTLGSSGFIEYEGEHDQQVTVEPLGEREVVVYVGLQIEGHKSGARLAVRTLSDFFAEVCIDPDCLRYGQKPRLYHDMEYAQAEREGRTLEACRFSTRFTYLGPRLEGDML